MRWIYGSKGISTTAAWGRRWPVSGSQLAKAISSELEQVLPTRLILFFLGVKVKV